LIFLVILYLKNLEQFFFNVNGEKDQSLVLTTFDGDDDKGSVEIRLLCFKDSRCRKWVKLCGVETNCCEADMEFEYTGPLKGVAAEQKENGVIVNLHLFFLGQFVC
jgi:hypothetical protein